MKSIRLISTQIACSLYFQRRDCQFETLPSLSRKLKIPEAVLEPVVLKLLSMGILFVMNGIGGELLYAYQPPQSLDIR